MFANAPFRPQTKGLPAAFSTVFCALILLCGCASSRSIGRPLPPVNVPLPPAATPSISERERLLNEAMSQVLLAREQMRLGLAEEAEAAWNRAIDVLAPLAVQDTEIAGRLRAIVAERDQALADTEVKEEDELAQDEDGSADEQSESESVIILEAPEPEIDPAHVQEVETAVEEVGKPDYPVEINDRVIAWIEAYTAGVKEYMSRSIERSGLYIKRAQEIFAEEGLPKDLVYLAHVESGFKTSAYSRAAARGIYQFIAETGRRYGLTVNRYIDERAEPEKSARASASYLRDLYEEFKDWKLALAAYNAGEGRVRSIIEQTGIRNYWDPRFQRLMRPETRNYVPAIFAATLISKDPKRFGFGDIKPFDPVQYEHVEVQQPTSLKVIARVVGVDEPTLRALNPELRRGFTPPTSTYKVKVPVGSGAGFTEKLAAVPAGERQIVDYETTVIRHRVRRGESLGTIARRYGVSQQTLKAMNRMRSTRVRIGQMLSIPSQRRVDPFDPRVGETSRASAARKSKSGSHAAARLATSVAQQEATYYRVRRGDTLTEIAAKFDVEVSELQTWNGLGNSTRVGIGRKLRVRAPQDQAGNGNAPAAKPRAKTHTVRAGETAWRIAQQYGVTVDALLGANGLRQGAVLKPGMQLRIPTTARRSSSDDAPREASHTVHVVKRGETLARIAARYGVSIATICRLNNIKSSAALMPGDTLTIR